MNATMSASREKKKRQELYESGEIIRDTGKKANGGLSKLTNTLIAAAAIVILVAFVWLMITNSGTFLNNVTAVTVGDTKISAGEAGYYYWDAVSAVSNQYGDYFQYFVDTSKSYKSQQFSEDQTWADYFMSYAENGMQQIKILNDQANANGFTLTEDQKAEIDSTMAALESSAKSSGFRNGEAYLKTVYGKAASVKSFREYLTRQTLSNAYYAEVYNAPTFDKAERDSYYAEHKSDFDTVDYRMISLTDGAEAERIAADTANHEAMYLEEAAKLAEANDPETEYDADGATLIEDASYSNVLTGAAEWLFDEMRGRGETYVVEPTEDGGTYYVLYFLGRNQLDEKLVNVRHILISVDDTSDVDAMQRAKEEADAILEEWESGDATEDSFAELANDRSTDGGSNTNGGLYENVYPGQMVTEFNDWCFDKSRKAGDTAVVGTDYGYHVMYFSGYSDEYDSYQDLLVEATLRSQKYSDWYTALTEQYPIKEKGFGLHYVHQ